MERIKTIFQSRGMMIIVILIGLVARLAVSTFGHNYDMESYFLVAQIARHGGDVYLETTRYNYGPVWFQVIHLLDVLAAHHPPVLRYLVAGFLSAVDVGIFLVLCRQAGNIAGTLFFLNPISIIITGYHSQFDNLAVLLGLWAILLFGGDFNQPVNRRKFFGLLVLGLSLATKHILFAFPLWLAVKQKGHLQKMIVLLVPVLCFFAGFSPYWLQAHAGIIANVFDYHSSPDNFFYKLFVPLGIQDLLDSLRVWYLLLFLFAFFCRGRSSFESLLIYLGVLVAASPATANQYLAIPVALVAVYPNIFFAFYTAFSVLYLSVDKNGLYLQENSDYIRCKSFAIYALCSGIIWLMWRRQILSWGRSLFQEIKLQFKGD